jgi:hypothetical protein
MAERKSMKAHVLLGRLRCQHVIRLADDVHLMAALAQAGGGLKHLVDRAGVELVELEDLEDLHERGRAL